jgi:hypothetical protein
MGRRRRALVLLFFGLVGCVAISQGTWAQTTGDRISLYFGDWHALAPHKIRGSLEA